ncbi:MAG: MATE family efflux transporter [Lachnospiraceae bacterium]|nr:MATE family efflux transporter [Lachnospiraceae bacterium]
MVLAVAVPIMIENGITNFVNMLDNIMIGRVGTAQMSGVSIVNQLIFVFNLCLFGALSGPGIFTSQFYGSKDTEGVRNAFRFKLWLAAIICIGAILILTSFGTPLIESYLNGDSTELDATLLAAQAYLKVILIGLPPFALARVYAGTLRECGQTMLPMKAGVAAVLVNLVFNYLLIYGKFGFPELGVVGAAIATVLSRYVEVAIILIWTHTHTTQNAFARGLYRTLHVPGILMKQIAVKGAPLLANEALWSTSMAVLMQCYSIRGLNVVAAMNIANVIANVLNVVFFAMGDAVAIIVGQRLGAGDMEKARDYDNKLIAFAVFLGTLVTIAMMIISPFFPLIYNTTTEIRALASEIIRITGAFVPLFAFLHATYFTLRAGGRTVITFCFDCVFAWVVSVSIAYLLTHYTDMPITGIYTIVRASELLKCVIGAVLVYKGVWLRRFIDTDEIG